MREYMCRIFYSPPNSLEFEEEDLWEFFNRLERVGGGDGNGVYLIEEGIVEKCHEKMPLWASLKGGMLFHTRKATHGNVADYNTQPFVGNRYVLCHNGIFNEFFLVYIKKINTVTLTRCIKSSKRLEY